MSQRADEDLDGIIIHADYLSLCPACRGGAATARGLSSVRSTELVKSLSESQHPWSVSNALVPQW